MKKERKRLVAKSFEKWHHGELQAVFGLEDVGSSSLLTEWLSSNHPIPEAYQPFLEKLRNDLHVFKNDWNESDLRINFIGPLLFFVDFRGEDFMGFNDRPLSAEIGDYRIHGYVDWLAARKSPANTPLEPYFFIHEYKKFRATEADPLGQLLAAMLSAQKLNEDGEPLYGCYVVSDIWRFVLMEGKGYAVSQGFDATDKEELHKIWSVLVEVKRRIRERRQNRAVKP